MTTLEILTEVEAGRMSTTEALEMMETLIPGERYICGEYTGTFVRLEGDRAYFDMDIPEVFHMDINGLIGFRLEFAKTFKRI